MNGLEGFGSWTATDGEPMLDYRAKPLESQAARGRPPGPNRGRGSVAIERETFSPLEVPVLRAGPGFCIYSLLARTRFTWQNLAAGAQQRIDLGAYIPLERVAEALLVVRVHEIGLVAGQRIALELELVSLTKDEPERVFVSGVALATVQISANTPQRSGHFSRVGDFLGLHGRLMLQFDQAPSVTTGSVALSAELLTRTAADEETNAECLCDPE